MFNNVLLFTKALGLQDPWRIDKVELDADKGRLDLYISRKRGSRHPCPECGVKCSVHDTVKRTWRHLNFFQYRAYIHCDVPRVNCKAHGVKQVVVPWSRPSSGFTMLFEALIIELAKAMPVNTLANLVGEHDARIWRVIKHYVEEARKEEDFSNVVNVGIDETSSRRGHNYVSVFVDLDEFRVIYATEGKDASTVDSFKEDFEAHGEIPIKWRISAVTCRQLSLREWKKTLLKLTLPLTSSML